MSDSTSTVTGQNETTKKANQRFHFFEHHIIRNSLSDSFQNAKTAMELLPIRVEPSQHSNLPVQLTSPVKRKSTFVQSVKGSENDGRASPRQDFVSGSREQAQRKHRHNAPGIRAGVVSIFNTSTLQTSLGEVTRHSDGRFPPRLNWRRQLSLGRPTVQSRTIKSSYLKGEEAKGILSGGLQLIGVCRWHTFEFVSAWPRR